MRERRNVTHNKKLEVSGHQNAQQSTPGKKTLRPKLIVKTLACIALILLIIYLILFSGLLKVTSIEVDGLKTLSENDIEDQVNSVLNRSVLAQNILFVSVTDIQNELKKNNYQIAKIELQKTGINSILVTIAEQEPALLWVSGGSTSLLTVEGRAYDGEPNAELTNSLPLVEDKSNLPVDSSQKVVPSEFVTFVKQVKPAFEGLNLTVEQMYVDQTTTELNVTVAQGYTVRLDTTRDFNDQIVDLKAVTTKLKREGKKISEYIDLRIDSKVFYK